MLDLSFTGKTALVTGATSGIGLAIAEGLAACGARILINSENAEGCDSVVQRFRSNGIECEPAIADLFKKEDVLRLADEAREQQVSALFCNAGMSGKLNIGDVGYESEVERVFALNLHHTRLLCDQLLPHLSGGAAVLTASLAGVRGNKGLGVYSLTKAAIIQLARDMAVKFGPDGVRVNAVSPGLTATGWEKKLLTNPEATQKRMQMTPLRRIAQPSEIAHAALFLASDLASFITGQNLLVDGGTSISDGN